MGFFEHLPLKPRTAEDEEAEKKAKMDGLPTKNNATLYPVGLGSYNSYPARDDKFWEKPFEPGKREIHLPSDIRGNLYLKNAVPSTIDENSRVDADGGITYEEDAAKGKVFFKIDPAVLRGMCNFVVTSDILGKAYHAEMGFENPDGTPYRMDRDFFGTLRPEKDVMPGPFELAGDEPVEFTL